MALEATVLCLDGSEYMRNGDYIPTRLEAMKDAASLLCRIKTDMNAESTVGIVGCGLPLGPKVLCSCSQDMAALLSACSNLAIAGGKADFFRSLQVAALVLKHRRNKNGDQRIVAFVGSPIMDDEAKLVKLAKSLKKNNIAVSIVAMGEIEDNEPKLKAFIEAVDKSSNSHLVVIPAGVLPSEVLMTSPIITGGAGGGEGEAGAAGAGAAAAAFAEYGGVDPSIDPELAMALRASMEEARARMTVEEPREAQTGAQPSTATAPETPKAESTAPVSPSGGDDDEEEMLRQALMMSMKEGEDDAAAGESAAATTTKVSVSAASEDASEEDEDAKALALAIAMSQAEDNEPAQQEQSASNAGFFDPNYVKELMEGLGDVDINDPQIQALLGQSSGEKKPDGPDNKKPRKDEDESGGDNK